MDKEDVEKEKLLKLLDYWIEHNSDHEHEYKEWAKKIDGMGYKDVTRLLSEVTELTDAIQHHIEHARSILAKPVSGEMMKKKDMKEIKPQHEHITLHAIGVIHTPYIENIPENAEERDGEFIIEVCHPYKHILYDLKPGARVLAVYAFESYRSHISAEKDQSYISHNSSHNLNLNLVDVSFVTVRKNEKDKIKIDPIAVRDGARILFLEKRKTKKQIN